MTSITKSLPVCLDQVLQFDVYKSALQQTLSLEPTNAKFLKTREGINMWLNRLETFGPSNIGAKESQTKCGDSSMTAQ